MFLYIIFGITIWIQEVLEIKPVFETDKVIYQVIEVSDFHVSKRSEWLRYMFFFVVVNVPVVTLLFVIKSPQAFFKILIVIPFSY